MEKYVYRKYEPKYKILFSREKGKLKKLLPRSAKIFHIGSSAVPGLGGKGIIDILASVKKKELKKTIKVLQKSKYIFYHSGADIVNRYFFQKIMKYGGKERCVIIHLTFFGSGEQKRLLDFVSYLKNHPKVSKEYAKIKKEAAKYANGEKNKYAAYKNKIIKSIIKKLPQ